MSGPGPGPGPGDRYYRPPNGYPNSIYAQPSTIPARRPVGGPAAVPVDPAQVSPELSYPPRTTHSVSSSARSRMLQRMGTINSGGKFTVSPASSIHEDDDEEAYGYRGPAGLSPSPPRHYRDGAQTHGTAGWDGQGQGQGGEGGQAGLWHGQVPSHVQAQGVPHTTTATGTVDDNSRSAGVMGVAPALWQTSPDETEIPYPAPPHWRGSRDMQELNEARAREAESGRRPVRTSYGPAPVRTSASTSAATATVSDAPPSLPVPAVLIPGHRPKNESQIDVGVPHADTFPPIPTGLNRPKARRSWDRQRKRRRKAVIVAVLKTFDGRGLTDWPLTVSLNTVVAFLTAICQVALAVPLTEGLSQLKWNSFARSEKPLADFQTFENARRGPVSSAVLLCKRKGRAPSPIPLEISRQGVARQPSPEANHTPTQRRMVKYLDTRERQAIQSGIYHAVDVEVPPLQPLCSSGNCQWQNFSSLAVCAAVADISDRLTISNQSRPRNLGVSLGDANDEVVRAARLPNGLYLVGSTASCNLNISWPHDSVNTESDTEEVTDQESFLPARTSLAFSDQDGRVSSAIANFFLVYTNATSNTGSDSSKAVFRAAEVLLHFCVNTYEASTSRGVATSRVVHSSTLAAEDASGNSIVNARHESSSPPRVFLRSTNTDGVYSVKREDVKFLNGYILSLFSGVYSHWYGKSIGGETATSEALGLAMFQREPMRVMSSASASGTVFATESYVHIQWAWLTFLAIQVALSVSFLLGIMIQTAVWNVKILKGSSTAALLAIPADEKAYLEERENMFLDNGERTETSRKLKTITCRFRPGERGWSLEADKRENG
ncbi:hypothetical protein F5144DRAFT_588664 [Chaetomium tenue]|uniref:Uncharacterized protein n=1 Tax=Chaetomium tenue TaxID=1854479 RepID=A0ACB7PLZ0_9PEZI|nr:hypothetical protein F5144DRAFT_588664 [Chaetomium globosum]